MSSIRERIDLVNRAEMSASLRYLAEDPLPYRKANYTLPGHEHSTLAEADAWIGAKLKNWGYRVCLESCQAQAFRRDETKDPHRQYSPPGPEDPWYELTNVYGIREGSDDDRGSIWLVAHKDSQSWIDSPGANDNAIGTVGVLEAARLLSDYAPRHRLCLLFCNEEHAPWTSVTAATGARDRGEQIVGLFNTDGIGVRSPEDRAAGRMTNVTAYTVDDGLAVAELMSQAIATHAIPLEQRIVKRERPGDDDGSFVKAGFGRSVINIGSWPYADPNYHLVTDAVEHVDIENAALAVQAIVAAVLSLDGCGC